jgi:hypothetical protein
MNFDKKIFFEKIEVRRQETSVSSHQIVHRPCELVSMRICAMVNSKLGIVN